MPPSEPVRPRAVARLTNPLLVDVIGRDFVWHFRFVGPDGIMNTVDDVASKEVLHLPCEHDIRFVVHSEDYIYYFSVPELKLRQIAVPQLTYEKMFRTTTPGAFEMPVDPMCGMRLFHDRPMGRVVVEPQPQFIDWLSDLPATQHEVHSGNRPGSR